MHVRIARFEGAEAEALDKQLEGIRSQMAKGRERMAGARGTTRPRACAPSSA